MTYGELREQLLVLNELQLAMPVLIETDDGRHAAATYLGIQPGKLKKTRTRLYLFAVADQHSARNNRP